MHKFLTITLLFTCLPLMAKWGFHKQYDSTSIYKAPLGSRLVVESKMTATKDKKFSKSFLKGVEEKKAKMLAIIGVTNWQVSERDIKNHKDFVELTFSGSYLNRKGEQVFFHENHFYKNKSKIQFRVTNKDLNKLKKDLKNNSIEEVKKRHDL